jgi:hypothetical protein
MANFPYRRTWRPGGNDRGVTDRAGLEIVDYVLLGEGLAGFVVLHIVIGEDARKFGEVGSHEGAVAVCEELEDLLFVVRQMPAARLR